MSWIDKWELRRCTSREIDGIRISAMEDDATATLHRVEHALTLIREHDPHRYRAIRRHLSRIWIRLLPGPLALHRGGTCQLDTRYVTDAAVPLEDIAASIVHEAAHARIDRCVPYREELRQRIETACRRQELAFARRLPEARALKERVEAWLAAPPEAAFWSNLALFDRRVEGRLENLRHAGLPEWGVRLFQRLFLYARRRVAKRS